MVIRLLLLLNVSLCIIKSISSGGTGYLRIKHYENDDYKDASGRCCESLVSIFCGRHECDPYFVICLGQGCTIAKHQSNVYDGTDTINFGGTLHTTLGAVSNPIKFTFSSLKVGLPLKIDVFDHDKGNDADDPIGSIQRTVTQHPTLFGQAYHTRDYDIKSSMARITFSLNLWCDQYYYGDCSKYCQPYPQHYNCDQNGNKVCLQGWKGPNCDIDINPCRSNACMNGATCLNGQNSYICICPALYTGTFCKTIVIVTTPRSTTTTTTTATTTTITTTNPSTTTNTPTTTTTTTTPDVSTTASKASTSATTINLTPTTSTRTTTKATRETSTTTATTTLLPASGTISTTQTKIPHTEARTNTHSSITTSSGTLNQLTTAVTSLSYAEPTSITITANQMTTNLHTIDTTLSANVSASLNVTETSTSGSYTSKPTRKLFSKSPTSTKIPYTSISITQMPSTATIINSNITSKSIKTEEGSSSIGGIVGGLVGGLASVSALISLLYYFIIRKRFKVRSEQKTEKHDHNTKTKTEQKQHKEEKAED